MATDALDQEQSKRIQNLENRVNEVENQLSAILARLDTLTSIGKALAVLAGAAIGVDVLPMLGA
jgi:tetrahydromethanopterin S-methyltransferase subunit G|tara:strand:- start:1595 stop:1786 length:192 start_codon:yes stop_codon:yes gene_type:complete